MAGITSLKIGVKTADERQNAAVRLRPGQSAVAAGEATAKASSARAEAEQAKAEDKPAKAEAFKLRDVSHLKPDETRHGVVMINCSLHPDIIESDPEQIGKPKRADKHKDDSIAYLRRQNSHLRTRAERLQKEVGAMTAKLHALEAKRDSQKKERGEMYRTSIKVAAGLRREIATEQRARKKADAEVTKLTRIINASRDENTELRSVIAKLEQAILLGPGNDFQE